MVDKWVTEMFVHFKQQEKVILLIICVTDKLCLRNISGSPSVFAVVCV